MSFSEVASSLLSAIEDKEATTPVCPTIEYVHKNISAFVRLQKQFYNPQAQEALTCLVRTAIRGFKTSYVEKTREVARDLASVLRHFFGEVEDIPRRLVIRTADPSSEETTYPKQIEELVTEAYAGIVVLNDLRAITPSFKYVYAMINCGIPERDENGHLVSICSATGGTPYLIEESLESAPTLQVALNELSTDKLGVLAVKSILFQLFVAVHYASKENVSNFPTEIRVRKVDTDMVVPVKVEGEMKYILTYGYVPVFERYHTVAIPVKGRIVGIPKSYRQEQDDLTQYVVATLTAVNPKLREIFPVEDVTKKGFFDDVLRDSAKEEVILSCEGVKCPSLENFIRYFDVPFARLHAFVRSGVERIDQLRLMLETSKDPDLDFLISGVMINYAETLEDLASQVSEGTRAELFPGERYYRVALSESRYIDPEKGIIKPDLDFVRESFLLDHTKYNDPQYLKGALDVAMKMGRRLHEAQRSLPLILAI